MNQYLILFDGYCTLCDRMVNFLIKIDRKKKFTFIPQKAEEATEIIQLFKIDSDIDSLIVIKGTKAFIKSEAVFQIISELSFPIKLGLVFRIFPLKFRDYIYDILAQKRNSLFGKPMICNNLNAKIS